MNEPCPITSLQQISGRGFTPCLGKQPRTGDRQLEILFRNGLTSKFTYSAKQLRWSIENHPFDVVGYR